MIYNETTREGQALGKRPSRESLFKGESMTTVTEVQTKLEILNAGKPEELKSVFQTVQMRFWEPLGKPVITQGNQDSRLARFSRSTRGFPDTRFLVSDVEFGLSRLFRGIGTGDFHDHF
jgi:hypothetical protein